MQLRWVMLAFCVGALGLGVWGGGGGLGIYKQSTYIRSSGQIYIPMYIR